MVSEWMKNGTINDFLKRVDADRLELVCLFFSGCLPLLTIHDCTIAVARRSRQGIDIYT